MNPARPGELAALSPSGTAADVDAAISAAAAAQPGWAAMPAPSRGAILMAAGNLLLDRQTAIAEDLVREEGKTLAEAKGEVKRASDVLRFFGSARLGRHRRSPAQRPAGHHHHHPAASRSASSGSSPRGTSPSPSRPGRSPPH